MKKLMILGSDYRSYLYMNTLPIYQSGPLDWVDMEEGIDTTPLSFFSGAFAHQIRSMTYSVEPCIKSDIMKNRAKAQRAWFNRHDLTDKRDLNPLLAQLDVMELSKHTVKYIYFTGKETDEGYKTFYDGITLLGFDSKDIVIMNRDETHPDLPFTWIDWKVEEKDIENNPELLKENILKLTQSLKENNLFGGTLEEE